VSCIPWIVVTCRSSRRRRAVLSEIHHLLARSSNQVSVGSSPGESAVRLDCASDGDALLLTARTADSAGASRMRHADALEGGMHTLPPFGAAMPDR